MGGGSRWSKEDESKRNREKEHLKNKIYPSAPFLSLSLALALSFLVCMCPLLSLHISSRFRILVVIGWGKDCNTCWCIVTLPPLPLLLLFYSPSLNLCFADMITHTHTQAERKLIEEGRRKEKKDWRSMHRGKIMRATHAYGGNPNMRKAVDTLVCAETMLSAQQLLFALPLID